MSQCCSSPWDLNIAPLTITAVTHRLIVTFWPRLYKRELKLTYSRAHKQRQRHILICFFFVFPGLWCYHSDGIVFTHLSDFVCGFICAPENTVSVWDAGRWGVPTTIGQLNVSQHLMRRLRSEFVGSQLRGHPLVLLYSLDMLVLQATAQPRVGGVFLYTTHFLFSDTGFFSALIKVTSLDC